MKPRHALAGCAAILAGCTPSPAPAVRGRHTDPSTVPARTVEEAAPGSSEVPMPSPLGAASSSTVVVGPLPATTVEPTTEPTTTVTVTLPHATTTTTLVLPERADAAQSDQEWWDSQPGRCGGSLPPCWVMQRESGGNIHAVNPSSGAAGKWQMMPATSRDLGYPRPMNTYDEATQDEAAERLWNGGRGCSHWDAC